MLRRVLLCAGLGGMSVDVHVKCPAPPGEAEKCGRLDPGAERNLSIDKAGRDLTQSDWAGRELTQSDAMHPQGEARLGKATKQAALQRGPMRHSTVQCRLRPIFADRTPYTFELDFEETLLNTQLYPKRLPALYAFCGDKVRGALLRHCCRHHCCCCCWPGSTAGALLKQGGM